MNIIYIYEYIYIQEYTHGISLVILVFPWLVLDTIRHGSQEMPVRTIWLLVETSTNCFWKVIIINHVPKHQPSISQVNGAQ